jgi:hypothetical protein
LLPEVKPRVVLPNESKKVPFIEAHGISSLKLIITSLGYCLVTFFKANVSPFRKEYEGLVKGEAKFMVEYQDKFYVFVSEENKSLFMRLVL